MPRGGGAAAPTIDRSFADLCADDRAFASWYDTALPRVYGFVYARTGGDSALAEDVTAMAFLEAVRARRSFTGASDPVTWICSIARNRLIDHFRSESRDRARRLRLIVTEADTQDEAWRHLDARDAALSALAALPSSERLALTLRYIDGYSVREIAGLMGRSEAATESLLVRARDRVRAAFPGGPE